MAAINFKGKNIIWNHHLSVPYHTLDTDEKLSYKKNKADGNLIIEGDNLIALKALLPTHSGKIKCIYIDVPYNTGNEKWIYNDNVNSPVIKKWIGQEVGKDDLTRHDKWLCMMTPRLKLLRDLLTDDGVIFISIDDNEVNNLKLLMDEIFGENNFIATIVAQLNPRGRTLDRYLAKTYEYILLYAKNASNEKSINLLSKEGESLAAYSKTDKNGKKYRDLELRNRNPVFNRQNRPNLFYPLYVSPESEKVSLDNDLIHSIEVLPRNSQNEDGCWTWGKTKVKDNINLLSGKHVSTGAWRIYRMDYLEKENGEIATTKAKALWTEKEINNENGKETINDLFGKPVFDFPKSVALIKKCIKLGSGKNSIILDSYAGSGTTAHAVLELNDDDEGKRRFILIQLLEEIAPGRPAYELGYRFIHQVTSARVQKAISKNKYNSGFEYKRIGIPIDAESMLAGNLPAYKQLAKYVYYLATGKNLEKESKIDETNYYVGEHADSIIYLIYKQDFNTLTKLALNLGFAEKITKKDGQKKKIIYAPACYLDEEYLAKYKIQFVSIPYNLFERVM